MWARSVRLSRLSSSQSGFCRRSTPPRPSQSAPILRPISSFNFAANSYLRAPPTQGLHPRKSAVDPILSFAALTLLAGGAYYLSVGSQEAVSEYDEHRPATKPTTQSTSTTSITMVAEISSGRPGNLTAEQELKLKEMWSAAFDVFGVSHESSTPVPSTTTESTPAKRKSKLSFFGKKSKDSGDLPSGSDADNDKHGLNMAFHEALSHQSPEELREAFWSMTKHDNPDALLLRFLRARKWDVQAALVMLVSAMRWRTSDFDVDGDIMRNGEAHALRESESSDPAKRKEGQDFMTQLRTGKSFLYGMDKDGRPCCYVRVRLHRSGEQSEASLERFTVYLIETARMELHAPVDTATIVFDMTDFSLANMDYTPVKFMIKCFEANYPESLGSVLVYKAPWVFTGIWKIIKGWLDPVVAGKVHFASNVDDLAEYIPRDRIIQELGGERSFTYEYVEPVVDENKRMEDTATRDQILSERRDLVQQYQSATLAWVHNESQDAEKRTTLATQLADNYWRLDPYVRARSLYDRTGVIQEGGKIVFYPNKT